MAYWCSFWLLRWWQFWRMPETEHTRRVETARHRIKVDWVRRLWFVGALIVLAVPSPPFAVAGGLLLTFLSFVLLDETV